MESVPFSIAQNTRRVLFCCCVKSHRAEQNVLTVTEIFKILYTLIISVNIFLHFNLGLKLTFISFIFRLQLNNTNIRHIDHRLSLVNILSPNSVLTLAAFHLVLINLEKFIEAVVECFHLFHFDEALFQIFYFFVVIFFALVLF